MPLCIVVGVVARSGSVRPTMSCGGAPVSEEELIRAGRREKERAGSSVLGICSAGVRVACGAQKGNAACVPQRSNSGIRNQLTNPERQVGG